MQIVIADLEKSGIKSHTIRIWEKRYDLKSFRTDTNIRAYNDDQLKKILNVSFLINNGMKISKVASLSNDEISEKVLQLTSKSRGLNPTSTPCVMFTSIDQVLFNNTYEQLREKYNLPTYMKMYLFQP